MDRDQLTEHLRFAAELGVAGISRDPAWRTRQQNAQPSVSPSPEEKGVQMSSAPTHGSGGSSGSTSLPVLRSTEGLPAIRADIGDCTRCKLHTLGRTQVVFGSGNPNADLMFVGEAPGADEDAQGVPFVGRAGQLLTKIIEA